MPPLVGIDISSTTVKLLELSRKGFDYRVESYAVAPLSPEAVIEKNVNHAELVAEVIRDLVARSGTKARRAVAAVSGSAVITKTIAMPAGLSDRIYSYPVCKGEQCRRAISSGLRRGGGLNF